MHKARHTCYKFIFTSVCDLTIFLIPSNEEISIFYKGIKKMVKSQTVRSINKLVDDPLEPKTDLGRS